MITSLVFDFGRVISVQKPDSLFQNYEKDLGLRPQSINTIMFDSPYWHRALTGEIDMPTYWQKIGPLLNLDSKLALKRFQERYYEDEKMNNGVVQIIQDLSKNYKLAVLSNHPQGLHDWLADWQIDGFFKVIVCSADVGLVKPDARIFELLLKRLKESPEHVAFIDDTTEHVTTAQALGMHGILFTTADDLKEELMDLGCLSSQTVEK